MNMIQSAIALPYGWQPVVTDDIIDDGGSHYTYYIRQVGPWRLEIFPADTDGGLWHGQVELADGRELSVYGSTLAEAAAALESAVALALVSMLMNLVGSGLADQVWETAVAAGEEWHA